MYIIILHLPVSFQDTKTAQNERDDGDPIKNVLTISFHIGKSATMKTKGPIRK